MNKKIRVLVVDDSAVMRQLLTEILSSDSGIEVVGTAPDPYVAREKIKLLNPDVLTLDVEMPRMDGLAFLRNLMRLRPMPVVMCSSLTQDGATVALDALSLGAIDFVAKPAVDVAHGIRDAAQEIISKVKMAAHAQVRPLVDPPVLSVADRHGASVVLPKRSAPTHFATTDRIIAIGASTGGTEAIKDVLSHLPSDIPGIVIAQHIPKAFSGSFALRLDASSALNVCEARDDQPILAGHAYLAPGEGLKEMRDAGASTIAQDENSSVVWGMPGAAWQIGAVQSLHALHQIDARIVDLAGAHPEAPQHKSQSG